MVDFNQNKDILEVYWDTNNIGNYKFMVKIFTNFAI